MACNCLDTTKELIKNHLKDSAGEISEVTCDNMAIVLSNPSSYSMFIPFRVKGTKGPFKKKNGEVINMFPSFCPFCGEKNDQSS